MNLDGFDMPKIGIMWIYNDLDEWSQVDLGEFMRDSRGFRWNSRGFRWIDDNDLKMPKDVGIWPPRLGDLMGRSTWCGRL